MQPINLRPYLIKYLQIQSLTVLLIIEENNQKFYKYDLST